MTQSRPKKQHFVPRFYLENFAISDSSKKIWTYDTQWNRLYGRVARETAVETNFYSFKDEDGQYRDDIEIWLSHVEGKAAGLYSKVLAGEILNGQERADFAMFLATLYARSPSILRVLGETLGAEVESMMNFITADRKRFDDSVNQYISQTGKMMSEEIKDRIFNGLRDKSKYALVVNRNAMLQAAIEASERLARIFFQMGWVTTKSKGPGLITGDSPVVQHTAPGKFHPVFGGGGFLRLENFVSVPLSPQHCLELYWDKDYDSGVMSLTADRVRDLNRERAIFSDRFLFSSIKDDGIRNLGQKYKDEGLKVVVSGPGRIAPIKVKGRMGR
ncbi:MAG: DUF4238 domain-containing protein [Hyphomicrobiales bacterium]|nr:DUF4238 domain-containing protein [Hyphomicrobiales bacterium]